MAAIIGQEKMGFYATPDATEAQLCKLIKPATTEGQVFLLDPCCGEGKVLNALANSLNTKTVTFGIELSDSRSEVAKGVLDRVVNGDLMSVSISKGAFGLMLNNPPYDHSLNSTAYRTDRLEVEFLKYTIDRLMPGGVLIYIIKFESLQRCAGDLAKNFSDIAVYRVAEVDYPQFTQIVVFGKKREKAIEDWESYKDDFNRLIYSKVIPANQWRASTGTALKPKDLPYLEAATTIYEVPTVSLKKRLPRLRKFSMGAEEMTRKFIERGAHTTGQYQDALRVDEVKTLTPAAPIKMGHLGGLIASGKFGIITIGDMIIRGDVAVETAYLDEEGNETDEDNSTTEIDRLVPILQVVHRNGQHETIRDPQRLGDFFTENAVAMSEFIREKMKPLYAEPTSLEWSKIGQLALAKQIPGNEPGLTVAQKHATLASFRTLKEHRTVFLVGEQGTGKTVMGPGIVGMFDKPKKTVVLCPAHLIEKWAREIPQVIPNAKAVIAKEITDIEKAISEDKPEDWLFIILSKEQAKLGSGWQHALDRRLTRRGMKSACPRCGGFVHLENDKKHFCSNKVGSVTEMNDEGIEEKNPILCGSPLHEFNNQYLKKVELIDGIYCVPDLLVNKVSRILHKAGVADFDVISSHKALPAGNMVIAPHDQVVIKDNQLYIKSSNHRWPLADYIRKKHPHVFDVLIADECHKFNGHTSDQARAYHQLLCCTRYTINLTGTIMGGKATDLFWIFYRNLHEVRAEYEYSGGDSRWSGHYGRMIRVYKIHEGNETGQAGRTRRKVGTREAPGINPALYGIVLKYCVFLRVEDLGFNMPDYKEIVTYVDVPSNVQAQLDKIDEEMKEAMKERRGKDASDQDRRERMVILGNWLQRMLGRPNVAYRSERVMWIPHKTSIPFKCSDGKDLDLPKCVENDLLPKEKVLVERAKEQKALGNKLLVYLRQTGTADIRPRIETILRNAGINAVSLPDSLAASKREAWINKHADSIDVLLTNPRNVETGLDLIHFNHICVYEPETSLYILWQAERRIWRPGQIKDCTVEYMVYSNTMEDRFINLMMEKKGAAYMLYGDDPGGAMVTTDSDNVLVELARRALNDASIKRSSTEQKKTVKENIWAGITIPKIVRPTQSKRRKKAVVRLSWKEAMKPTSKKYIPAQMSFLDMFADYR